MQCLTCYIPDLKLRLTLFPFLTMLRCRITSEKIHYIASVIFLHRFDCATILTEGIVSLPLQVFPIPTGPL